MQNVDDATDKSAEKVLFARSFLSGSMCLAIKLGFHEWHSRLFWNDYRINESRIGFRRQKRMGFDENFWNCENKVLVIFDFWKPRQFFSQKTKSNVPSANHRDVATVCLNFTSRYYKSFKSFFNTFGLLRDGKTVKQSGVCKKKKIFGDYTFEL